MARNTQPISKTATPRQTLGMAEIWSPQNNRFDDGVPEIHHPEGERPPSQGQRFKELMATHGVTESEVADKSIICCDCKKSHTRTHRTIRCLSCEKIRKLKEKSKKNLSYRMETHSRARSQHS